MVSLPGSELGNVLLSTIQEVCLPVHVLSAEEVECHQFVPCLNGEVFDHQRLHEAVWVRLVIVGFSEPRHCVVSRQTICLPKHAVL